LLVLPCDAFIWYQLYPRHCEEQSDEAIHSFLVPQDGLLRFARNDVLSG
jgi:hypothetical protein